MEVFRIAKEELSKELTASDRANRWNSDDQLLIYTGSSRSLSTLEQIVHKNSVQPVIKYKVMIISIADEEELFTQILQENLSKSWRSMIAYPELQRLGSNGIKIKLPLC